MKEFLSTLDDGEDVTFEINSPGGSCTAGIAISNMIRKCSAEGHRTIAHVMGIAASMASVVACACDTLMIDSNAFLMCHNPWTCVEGNAEELRKEADTLDKFKKALVATYKTKFDMDQISIEKMMDEETWILGEQSDIYNLKCEVIPNNKQLKVAACLLRTSFNNIPTNLKHLISSDNIMNKKINNKTEEKNPEETKEPTEPIETKEPTEPKETKEPTEPKSQDPDCPNEDDPEVLKVRIEELEKELKELKEKLDNEEEMVPKKECEKRVSGMQSKMQAKINDFVSQLQVKDEELNNVKAKLTSLNQKLEEANGELSNMASALEEKKNALEKLNAGVLKSAEELPTMKDGLAKCATPKDKVEFLKSGKYVR